MSRDIVAVWEVDLSDGVYRIEFEHGTTTGKRVIHINGKVGNMLCSVICTKPIPAMDFPTILTLFHCNAPFVNIYKYATFLNIPFLIFVMFKSNFHCAHISALCFRK